MKKLFPTILMVYALCVSTAIIPGCATSPVKPVYVAEGTTIKTVDTAMQAWADWVKQGNATAVQVAQVKAAYQKYYAAQNVVHVAMVAYLTAATTDNANSLQIAVQAFGDSVGPLISLISTFTGRSFAI